MAQLQFSSGATALLQGPCEFQIDSAMSASLVVGRAAITVPPAAQGFSVSTPTAEIVDLGTEFGVDAGEEATDVTVFVGVVTVALRKDGALSAAQRVQAGESVRASAGTIQRSTTLALDRPIVRELPQPLISSVTSSTGNPYRVAMSGLHEDVRAYTDEPHEWNGVDAAGIPAALLGAEYVRTANLDRDHESFEVRLELSQPATLYVFWNRQQKPPAWLTRDFEKTDMQIGLDAVAGRGWPPEPGVGAGQSVDIAFDVWRRTTQQSGAVTLGPTQPHGSAVFGIALQPTKREVATPKSN